MLDSSLNTVSPLQTSGFVALALGQSPLWRHKKCFWTWLLKLNIPRGCFLVGDKKFWSCYGDQSWLTHWVCGRVWVQWDQQIRKDWCRCVKTVFGGFLHLNLRFSGHSCFYQTDRIGLVAAGGKLVTVKVVLTKESQAPPKMLMSVEIFSQNDDVNGNFLPNCWCQWKISGIFYRFYPLHEIELGWEMFLMPELFHSFFTCLNMRRRWVVWWTSWIPQSPDFSCIISHKRHSCA